MNHPNNYLKNIARSFAALVIVLGGLSAAEAFPLHNFNNPRDVDDNGLVDLVDLSLVAEQIRLEKSGDLILPLQQTSPIYADTSNDSKLTPQDVLIVANYLLRETPEPATMVSGLFGLLALAGYCWRQRRLR